MIYLQGGGGYTLMASGRGAGRCLQKALQTPGATVVQGPCTVEDATDCSASNQNFRTDAR